MTDSNRGDERFGGSDPLAPSAALLCKLGSLAVHADELINGPGVRTTSEGSFDLQAILVGLSDPEVKAWIEEMDALSLLPKKRDA